ncbi:MAG TPA: sugar porter family MFS transporter [Verrucomicrobiae bacterium]|jgi:SP family arabinose:H+ symporter-like MFS transporter|nr:sugar porter family MFS transporter [Verrucomicrobiae bacterium]
MALQPVESSVPVTKSPSIRGPMLLLVACVALAGGFLFGYDTAVINGANQFLKTFFKLTSFQEGIAGASAILGCIPGAMFAGFLSDRYGRRKVLFVCAILYALSGVLSAMPNTFTEFLLARFISGLGIGASSMICPVYVAELAPAVWRGRFGSLFQFGIVSGIFLTLFINAKIQAFGDADWNVARGWRWMLGAEVLPAMLLLILLFFVKESPRWLVQMGREDEARNILEKIHGSQEIEAEIAATKDVLKQSEAGFFELLSTARFRRVLVIAVLLMAFSQFSGINAIMYYSTKIFTTAGVGVKDSFMASTVVGLVNLLFTLVAVALVDKAGRRILLLVGLVAQVIALGAVGWMFKANTGGIPLLIAILAFIGAFAMALGPIPWILCSEIFPTRVRGRAMSVATFTIWTACYIVAQTFPMLNDSPAVGPALTFWIYAACSLAALIFVFFMVPETKGRSLEEIEASFAGGKA